MTSELKKAIGARLRAKREAAGYTREALGELCALSPRFIANIEFGDSTFSMDSLLSVCRVLSCGADELLFGPTAPSGVWDDTLDRVRHLDPALKPGLDKLVQSLAELSARA